jgi:hypothetical protein
LFLGLQVLECPSLKRTNTMTTNHKQLFALLFAITSAALSSCSRESANTLAAPQVLGIADNDAVPPKTGSSIDLLYTEPLTGAVTNVSASPLADSTARLPDLAGIKQASPLASGFPYLEGMAPAFRLEVVAEEMPDTLSTAPGKGAAEYFAIGPRTWSQPGQLYRATLQPTNTESVNKHDPKEAVAEVERLWLATGATLVTSSIKHDNLIRLPIAYWPNVCSQQMVNGPACSALRTYAMKVGEGQVWLQVGIHSPTKRAWVSAMRFGRTDTSALASVAVPSARPAEMNTSTEALSDVERKQLDTAREYTRRELLDKRDMNKRAEYLVGGTYSSGPNGNGQSYHFMQTKVDLRLIADLNHHRFVGNVRIRKEGSATPDEILPYYIAGNVIVIDTIKVKMQFLIFSQDKIVRIADDDTTLTRALFR